MSTYFSKIIKAGERQREFNFRQVTSNNETRYSVDVPDERGNRVMFNMQRNEDGSWRTTSPSLPVWIQDAEAALDDAIRENRLAEMPKKHR